MGEEAIVHLSVWSTFSDVEAPDAQDVEFAIARGIELVRQLGETGAQAHLARVAVEG